MPSVIRYTVWGMVALAVLFLLAAAAGHFLSSSKILTISADEQAASGTCKDTEKVAINNYPGESTVLNYPEGETNKKHPYFTDKIGPWKCSVVCISGLDNTKLQEASSQDLIKNFLGGGTTNGVKFDILPTVDDFMNKFKAGGTEQSNLKAAVIVAQLKVKCDGPSEDYPSMKTKAGVEIKPVGANSTWAELAKKVEEDQKAATTSGSGTTTDASKAPAIGAINPEDVVGGLGGYDDEQDSEVRHKGSGTKNTKKPKEESSSAKPRSSGSGVVANNTKRGERSERGTATNNTKRGALSTKSGATANNTKR